MAIIQFTAAPSGTGKSYDRCARFLSEEWLPTETGVHWSNFPVKIDPLVAYVVGKHPELHAGTLYDRVRIIPDDVMQKWKRQESGPWDFFRDKDLNGCHIAIDEVHNFCNVAHKKEHLEKWQNWVGEIRHTGCTIEFLSQYETKVHHKIRHECGVRRSLFNGEDRRDPWFSIVMGDWYNLRAGLLTGEYRATIYGLEQKVIHGKWSEAHSYRFELGPPYFDFYDSYSAPVAGGVKALRKEYPFQTRGKLGILAWFIYRNSVHLALRFALVGLVIWASTHGALITGSFFRLMSYYMPVKNAEATNDKSTEKTAVTATGPSASGSAQPGSFVPRAAGGPLAGAAASSLVAVPADPKLKSENEKLAKELADIRDAEKRKSEVVFISETEVMLRSGQRLIAGDTITMGPLVGRKIKAIDYARHAVRLDDGSLLSLDH